MHIKFYSFIDGQKVFLEGQAIKINDFIGIKDEENKGYILYKINNHTCQFKRTGLANMELEFDLSKDTIGHYCNNLGLEFNLVVKTKRLERSDEKIIIEYDYYLDTEYQQTVKLYLITKNGLEKV